MRVKVAVEGDTDEAVARRILETRGHAVAGVFGRKGKGDLDKRLASYNAAARFEPWLVLRDLDRDEECAAALVRRLLPNPAGQIRLRIAVRQAEAWLLADAKHLAAFLGIAALDVPLEPESLPDAKRTMVELARRSRKRDIKQDMVPRAGLSAAVGPAYVSRLIEFTRQWQPSEAAARSPSLAACLRALDGLANLACAEPSDTAPRRGHSKQGRR